MKIAKNILILLVVLIISYLFGAVGGDFYNRIFNQSTSYADLSFISGFPFVYILFLVLLFTLFGDEKKYWWIGILLIPALAFELYFDFEHIYFPIILGIAGWLLAQAILKLKPKS